MNKLTKFEGHVILYCKGHYRNKNFLNGLYKIFSLYYCYDYLEEDVPEKDKIKFINNIAKFFFTIISKLKNCKSLKEISLGSHDVLNSSDLLPMENIIFYYKNIILTSEIKDSLPEPNKDLFKKIFEENFNYNYCKLINQ
jgi:hypothetical protein